MCAQITKAMPTDDLAISYLKEQLSIDEKEISPISAEKAKTLYPSYITDKFNFQCPTIGCMAPITCRSISKDSCYRPTFINRHIQEDHHIDGCIYSPMHESSIHLAAKTENERKHVYSSTDDLESHLPLHFFKEQKLTAKTIVQSTSTPIDNELTSASRSATSQYKNSKSYKEIIHHLYTMQDHVECFLENRNKLISNSFFDKPIPIKNLFTHICQNDFIDDISQHDFLKIAFGSAHITSHKTMNKLLVVTFKESVDIRKETKRRLLPSFLISRLTIESDFPDLLQYIDQIKSSIRVFIRAPFTLKKLGKENYLNFAITPTYLLHNIYFHPYREEE